MICKNHGVLLKIRISAKDFKYVLLILTSMNHAVIMAGGYGERFWPLSRKSRPKQCLPIHTEKPMIKETADSLVDVFGDSIYISTGKDMAGEIKKIMPKAKFIVEPMSRNTAACIGLSAITLLDKDPDAIMFLETADHMYEDQALYIEHIRYALKIAKKDDVIVLMGIKPTYPHTGLGYIEKDEIVYDDKINLYKVKCFKEKPDLKTAKEFVESGNFLWNSGMFIAKCKVMLDEIKNHMPKLYEGLMNIKKSGFDESVVMKEFEKFEKISIDYGVMEPSEKTCVIDADMHWDDIGDLAAYDRFSEKDKAGNVRKGEIIEIDSKNNIVLGKKLIALLGVENLIIAETDDVILVADKKRSQDVKKIVQKLSENKDHKKYE